ncbi:unnamed protein product, partial [Nesidiocoris tenuis]
MNLPTVGPTIPASPPTLSLAPRRFRSETGFLHIKASGGAIQRRGTQTRTTAARHTENGRCVVRFPSIAFAPRPAPPLPITKKTWRSFPRIRDALVSRSVPRAKMSESTTPKRDSWMEMGEVDGRKARFQVNRVDSTGDRGEVDAEEMDRLCTDDDDDEYLASYGKSFRHFTREALPRMDNYRNIMSIQAAARPTLEELHNETLHTKVRLKVDRYFAVLPLGAISSMRAIRPSDDESFLVPISNRKSKKRNRYRQNSKVDICRGTYFMISRSLGPEFGASIGLIFSLANAVACAMYTVGFCESINDLFETFSFSIVDGGIQDMRIVGTITIILLLGIVIIGMEWEAKDPQTAIPKGTILAIILTTGSYLLMALLSGSAVLRDASGNVTEYLNGTGTFADCSNRTCMYGLQNSFQ